MKPKGMVYLVGAGPGDAGLLTLRAAELLERADVVVYDGLVKPEALRLAPKSAEFIGSGQRATGPGLSANELSQLLIAKARAGKTVVRLIGGDPYFFGGGGEEAEQLADAGVPFEVVPGIPRRGGAQFRGGPTHPPRVCLPAYASRRPRRPVASRLRHFAAATVYGNTVIR